MDEVETPLVPADVESAWPVLLVLAAVLAAVLVVVLAVALVVWLVRRVR